MMKNEIIADPNQDGGSDRGSQRSLGRKTATNK